MFFLGAYCATGVRVSQSVAFGVNVDTLFLWFIIS